MALPALTKYANRTNRFATFPNWPLSQSIPSLIRSNVRTSASPCGAASSGRLLRQHVVVELLFVDPEPQVLVLEEFLPGLVNRLPLWVLRSVLGIEFLRRLVAGVENLARERPQLCTIGDETTQGCDIVGVVFRQCPCVGLGAGCRYNCLVGFRQ